ncbi:MAG: right-handed parallel beta-helix repeat-containing protein [Geobacteraceae bacterium]|nr:right-handed parallel beta-helix repeat-containing protein [Geobacteraceae bacterium]NTW80788.1 right-handed parallel beta-helix repeat-containing protein [Geobacteraceae bacterium]
MEKQTKAYIMSAGFWFVFALSFLQPPKCFALTHLTQPIAITANTTLQDDYVCDTTCFIVKGNNITLDFNGHTATFGNGNVATVANDTFSNWIDGSTPTNWTLISGTATKTASKFPFGSWDAVISATASLKSTTFTLRGGKTYLGFAFAQGASTDSYLIELKKASDNSVLFAKTVTGDYLNRGYADAGDLDLLRQYKPTVDTAVYLQLTGFGTSPKTIGMISIKPAYDYGVVQDSYQKTTSYEPDGPDYYGAANDVTIINGTISQGVGNGVRSNGIRYIGTNWVISNMTINMNGINTHGIDCFYCISPTVTNSNINSTSLSVFNRMHGTGGMSFSMSKGSHTITNNNISNVPQYGIFYYSCYAGNESVTSLISGNSISQNETVTEGYAIGISGVLNTTIDNNNITPIKGRGILVDAASGCNSPTPEKGTKNVTISNNNILGLYETRNAEYDEAGLEVVGIRIRNWGSSIGRHENLIVKNNTITASTDVKGAHRAYGININASSATDNIAIHDNKITVSASGTGKDANALSLQTVDMTTGGTLDIHHNTFTSSHQAVRFGGNDGSSVKGVTLRSNTLVQTGTPTVAPIEYGYWIGPETGNSLLDTIYMTSFPSQFCWNTSGQSDLTVKWSANITIKNALGQFIPGATVTATDSKSNTYVGTTSDSGFVSIVLPEFKKEGKGLECSTAGLTTTTFAPYKLIAEKDGVASAIQNFAGTATGELEILLDVAGSFDTNSPTVSITSPATSATIMGVVPVTVGTFDNIGVNRVVYYLNSSPLYTALVSPFSFSWNTKTVVNGIYSLSAKAYDAANNVGTSAAVSLTVNNPVTPPAAPKALIRMP